MHTAIVLAVLEVVKKQRPHILSFDAHKSTPTKRLSSGVPHGLTIHHGDASAGDDTAKVDHLALIPDLVDVVLVQAL